MNQSSISLDGLDGLSPITRETAQDRVYCQLRRSLICGGFDAGVLFKAGEVAERMLVSSMPVREALARLVSECALEAMPNRRVRVPLLSRERAHGIVKARILIEGELAKEALTNMKPYDVARLKQLTDEYEDAPDETAVAQANHAFHFSIYQRATLPTLLPFVESLWMQAGPYVRAATRLHTPILHDAATTHHTGILDAIEAGDRDGLVKALQADISQAFNILERTDDAVWDVSSEGRDG